MFLHAGWAHLLGNMLFLFIFGDNVEDAFGHLKYLLFYLACGIAAGLAQVYLAPGSSLPGVGASGAISGVLAAYIVMFGNNPVTVLFGIFPVVVPAFLMIGVWIVLQFLSGAASLGHTQETGGVAYGAHVGGFVCGLALTFVLRPRRQARRYYRRW
jgi:membrane associated rhomboid family serine protease